MLFYFNILLCCVLSFVFYELLLNLIPLQVANLELILRIFQNKHRLIFLGQKRKIPLFRKRKLTQ